MIDIMGVAMKIASSAVQMESGHISQRKYELQESLRMWFGNQRQDLENRQSQQQKPLIDASSLLPKIQLSDAGKAAQSSEASAIKEGIDAAENDPMLILIRSLVAMLTGHKFKVFDARKLQLDSTIESTSSTMQDLSTQAQQQPASEGFGVEYDRHESYSETEQTSFSSSGIVRTTDGKEISFSISLSMSRSYHIESDTSIRLGDAKTKQDPLALNFNGSAAQLTNQRFEFDLNSDGTNEAINFVTGGSGFLAFDRNGDGTINNGSELFGANTGNGFTELAALDDDHNGWIDENDAAFNQLLVWAKDLSGNDILSTLKQSNVGALNLANIATPFDIKDNSNDLQGQIRSSGVFLQEDGKAGTIQQIDLTI